MNHIVREIVAHFPIILGPAAKEAYGEAYIRKSVDDLVDPARDSNADIRKGSLQQ
jgi:CRISPR/Cas system CMR subunit Cmr4 (Cas7 group RAMP superfamily)